MRLGTRLVAKCIQGDVSYDNTNWSEFNSTRVVIIESTTQLTSHTPCLIHLWKSMKCLLYTLLNVQRELKSTVVSFPDPPPKRKGGSGEYSTSSHYGLPVAMDSTQRRLAADN